MTYEPNVEYTFETKGKHWIIKVYIDGKLVYAQHTMERKIVTI
jgi:hypothetical protein